MPRPPDAGALEEAAEARDPHDVHPRGPEIGVEGKGGQGHVASIGASHRRNAPRIGPARFPQPPGRRGHVVDGRAAQPLVVHAVVGLAVAGAPPDVGGQHHVAPVHQELDHGIEARPGLALGPAVDEHHGGAPDRGRRLPPRGVEKRRDLQPVGGEVREALRLHEVTPRDPRQAAARDALGRPLPQVVAPEVPRLPGGFHLEQEEPAVRRPPEAPGHAARDGGSGELTPLEAPLTQGDGGVAAGVVGHGDPAAIAGEGQLGDVVRR